jgi:hypothetical protein
MQIKTLNSYRITHKNGSVEEVNSSTPVDALENMEIEESYSPVVQLALVKENIRTLQEDIPSEVPFTAVVAEGGGGSIATPVSGTIHVGDTIAFKAIPARNYKFVSWKRNGVVISEDADFVYTMTALLEGDTSAVFTATFALADVEWTSAVSPEGATSAGAVAFPTAGTIEANGTLGLIAVEAEGYTFDHWERNGVSVGTNKILSATVTPLADDETDCVYTAVFTQE